MDAVTNRSRTNRGPSPGPRLLPGALLGAGGLCLLLAGGLLWWRRGGAVFESVTAAALGWCF